MRCIIKPTLLSCLVVLPATLPAAPTCPSAWVGKILTLRGSVQVQLAPGQTWQSLQLGDQVCPGNVIRVKQSGYAQLGLRDSSVITLEQNTTLVLSPEQKRPLQWLVKRLSRIFFETRLHAVWGHPQRVPDPIRRARRVNLAPTQG